MLSRLIIFPFILISILGMPLRMDLLLSDIDLSNNNAPLTKSEAAIKIFQVYGDLYEYKNNQSLHLLFNTPINPKYLNNITISTRNNSNFYYYIDRGCFYENNYSNGNVTNIVCTLDLSNIPKGDYLINYFYYENIRKVDKLTLITIKEDEDKKKNETEKIELIGIYSPGIEHRRDQNISLFFKNNENVNISLIKSMLIYKNSTSYNLSLFCLSKEKNNSVLCITDFTNLNSGSYEVIFYEYNYTYINASSNLIKFYINEDKQIKDDINLISIYGEAYTKNFSLITLVFNKNVLPSDFKLFILRDTKTNYDYFVNYTNPEINNNSSINILFDFRDIPKGLYYIKFVYKNKIYISNITLNIKEREIISENELLNVYHNFIGNEDNQIAYFSFYGKNTSDCLAYIVLSDEYSRINVLQTFDCQFANNNDLFKYDLRCKLNLTYVNKGAYTVSEYYINNQHYYTKKNINVIVQ